MDDDCIIIDECNNSCPYCDKDNKNKLYRRKKIFNISVRVLLWLIICSVPLIYFLIKDNKHKSDNYLMYFKNNSIYISLSKGKKPVIISENVVEKYDKDIAQKFVIDQIIISEDGKKLFYPKKMSSYGVRFDLHYKNIKALDKDVLIAKSVYKYMINKKADKVFYIKNNGFCCNDFKDETVIDSHADDFSINANGTKIIYKKGDLLYIYENGRKKLIDEEVRDYMINEDFSSLYYTKDRSVYYIKNFGEKKRIINDLQYILKIYDSGQIYYDDEDGNVKYYENNKTQLIGNILFDIIEFHQTKPVLTFKNDDGLFLVNKSEIKNITEMNVKSAKINNSADKVYYINNNSELDEYNLSTDKSSVYEYDTEYFFFLRDSDKFIYFKKSDYSHVDLYFGKKLIDSKVINNPVISVSNDNFLYFTSSKSDFKLNMYNRGNKVVVADNVRLMNFMYLNSDYIVYLIYEKTYNLYLDSKKPQLIDTDIKFLIPVRYQIYGKGIDDYESPYYGTDTKVIT